MKREDGAAGGHGAGCAGGSSPPPLCPRGPLAGVFLDLLGRGARSRASWPPGECSLGNAHRKEADMCPAVPEGHSLLPARPPPTIKTRLAQAHHTSPIFRYCFCDL